MVEDDILERNQNDLNMNYWTRLLTDSYDFSFGNDQLTLLGKVAFSPIILICFLMRILLGSIFNYNHWESYSSHRHTDK